MGGGLSLSNQHDKQHEGNHMNKTELQEKALQLEVSIYYPEDHEKEGKELTKDDLERDVNAKVDLLQVEHAQRETDKQKARESIAADDGDDDGDQDGNDEAPPKAKRRTKTVVVDPKASILKAMGLKVSDKDRTLARKHGYPVAVPGGKAYRTKFSFNCALGGGLRPMGSIVILTDANAEHKADSITPVK